MLLFSVEVKIGVFADSLIYYFCSSSYLLFSRKNKLQELRLWQPQAWNSSFRENNADIDLKKCSVINLQYMYAYTWEKW